MKNKKKLNFFDIAIVGNGIMGSMLSYNLSKKKCKTVLIGPKKRTGSASIAAGAMLNVFGEIDHDIDDNEYLKRKIKLGILASKKWKELKKNRLFNSVFTADDTILFLSRNATKLEKICFRSIKKIAKKYSVLITKHQKLSFLKKSKFFKAKELFLIKGEGAIDSKMLFNNFDNYFKNKKKLVYEDNLVKEISIKKDAYKIKCKNKKIFFAKKVVICNGAYLKKINFPKIKKVLDVYYGIGNALEIYDKQKKLSKHVPARTVIRSPNRGSTCGIHIVPRKNNEFYLGAGSQISHSEDHNPKIGTITYLINSFKKEIFDKISKLNFNTVVGFRPFSFDGQPMLGEVCKNLYIISGTKRDGLTLAPIIVDECVKKLSNKNYNSKIFTGWSPLRKPISFKNIFFSTQVYIDNKVAGLLEHKDIKKKDINRVTKELKKESIVFNKKIVKLKKLSNKFAVHPELLNTFK